jgi:trehalose 6-phosphate phosphatase
MDPVITSRRPPALDPRIPRALFLDVDGTLLEIAPTPDSVQVSERLKYLITRLSQQYAGALALVSGRSILQLDRLFHPMKLPMSGLHGIERRDAQGVLHRPSLATERLARAQSFLEAIVAVSPGLLLENKQATLAVHYRQAPELESVARRVVAQAMQILGKDYVMLEGKMVIELKPDGFSKSMAIAAFLREAPFQGRVPIFLGDDHTDETGFAYVEALRGTAIHVGSNESSHARWRLAGVGEVHDWLETLVTQSAARSAAR